MRSRTSNVLTPPWKKTVLLVTFLRLRCIKEQTINKDAPKTDDLVDEVVSTWSFQN